MANILTFPIFQDIILPFILIFVLVFAILQKSKLLGEGVQQINAIIAFVIAGILAAFSEYVTWIKQFVVFLVIALIILFIFMLIYGFAYAGKEGFSLSNEIKWIIAVLAGISVVVAALVITDTWARVYDFFTSSTAGSNAVFIIVIVAALAALLFSGKKSESK